VSALRGLAALGLIAGNLACAAHTDDFPREQAAAWQAAFDAGSAAQAAGDSAEAEARLREAFAIAQAEQPPGLRTGLALNGLAALAIDDDRYEEAEPMLRRALALLEAGGAGKTLHYAAALTNAGELSLRQDRAAEAEKQFARAASVAETQKGPSAAAILARGLAGRAEALRRLGRDAEAHALADRLAKLCRTQPSPVCASGPP
jgi:tetratricopeptide (TPR) repeat protein